MHIVGVCFLLLSLTNFSHSAKRKAQGKTTYELNWSEGFKNCDDFENSIIKATELKVVRDSPKTTILDGYVELTANLIQDTQIIINIEKETPQGKVLMLTMNIDDACKHISEEGMPWTAFFDAMKLDKKECPIPAKKYEVKELKLKMDIKDTILNHEHVGDYVARIEFQHPGEGLDIVEHTLACYVFGFSILEVRESS